MNNTHKTTYRVALVIIEHDTWRNARGEVTLEDTHSGHTLDLGSFDTREAAENAHATIQRAVAAQAGGLS